MRPVFVCLTGDMNTRISTLCDFITADNCIADLFEFDQETVQFYNQAEQLHTLNINKNRVSRDTNNNGYKLIEICINNNLFILNWRFGKDKSVGNLTLRNQSLIDYTICSFDCLKHLLDFEVIETDCLISDGHALLSWAFSATCCATTIDNNEQKMDSKLVEDFIKNISIDELNELYLNLRSSKQSIDRTISQIADIFYKSCKDCFSGS